MAATRRLERRAERRAGSNPVARTRVEFVGSVATLTLNLQFYARMMEW